MALEISYWTGTDTNTRQVYGRLISSESMTLTGVTQQSGAAPDGASLARVSAGEACRVTNSAASPTVTATNGTYLAAGDSIDLFVKPSDKLAAFTA